MRETPAWLELLLVKADFVSHKHRLCIYNAAGQRQGLLKDCHLLCAGEVWDSRKCVLVTQEDVPQVTSRGTELSGSSYPSGKDHLLLDSEASLAT